MPKPEKHIFICLNSRPPGHHKGSCTLVGAQELLTEFAEQLEARELKGRFRLTRTGCLGPCEMGPVVLVYPEGVMYGGVTAGDVSGIIDDHLLGGRSVERLRVPTDVW
ncbi:MAG: (2Fe-2S) ferredoxin domain-containing protein [Acidobacteriota bacterium]